MVFNHVIETVYYDAAKYADGEKSNSDNQRYSRGMQTDTSDHAACQTVEQVGQNHTSCCSWWLTSGNWSSLEKMLPELMSPFEAALLCVRLMVWRPTLHHQHRLSIV